MPNPDPKTDQIAPFQVKPKGVEALGRKVVGTRYPAQVEAILLAMSGDDRQDYIRRAVMAKLEADGLLPLSDP